MTMRVADYIADHLKNIGVSKVFLLSGGGMMHLVDGIGQANLPYICCHHEQACAMAAEGYARQAGALAVCYATSGPGATNLLTGLVGAWQDSSPVLFLTGQSKRSQTIRLAKTPGLRQFGTFEVDIVPVVSSVTKYAYFLDDPQGARFHLEKAIHLATSGRPGPVLLDIPLDVQGAPIDPAALDGFTVARSSFAPVCDTVMMRRLLDKLAGAARPILLIGHGVRCAGAVPAFRRLVDRLGVPVVTTQLAKDSLPYDHPLFVGHCGPKGDRAGNFAVQAADLILSVGCSLHSQSIGYEVDLFAPSAFKVQVDSDRAILDRGDVPVGWQIEADVGAFIQAMLTTLPASGAGHREWQARCGNWKRTFAVRAEPHIVTTPELNFYEFVEALSQALDGQEAIVTDAGSCFYVMGQAFRCQPGQRYIVSGALGSMGFALPAAIGMAAADNKPVVCVTGDGSLQTNIQELQTLKHNQPNIKLFVINNDGYTSIRNTQKGFFSGRYVGASQDSGVSVPDLAKVAPAYGLSYVAIDSRDDLVAQIRAVMAMPGPVVCGVRSQVNQQIIPTVSSRKLADGSLRSNPLHLMSPDLPADILTAAIGDMVQDLPGRSPEA